MFERKQTFFLSSLSTKLLSSFLTLLFSGFRCVSFLKRPRRSFAIQISIFFGLNSNSHIYLDNTLKIRKPEFGIIFGLRVSERFLIYAHCATRIFKKSTTISLFLLCNSFVDHVIIARTIATNKCLSISPSLSNHRFKRSHLKCFTDLVTTGWPNTDAPSDG